MNKSEELRHRAENCTELAQDAKSGPDKKRFERMADGWKTVANNQSWLDGEARPNPTGAGVRPDGRRRWRA